MVNNGYFTGRLQKFTHEDRVCIPVPLYHIFGTVIANLGCVTHGAAMIYSSEVFEPLTVLQTVHEEKCTVLMGVPTMFIALLDHPDFAKYDLSTLRTGVMAGSGAAWAPRPTTVDESPARIGASALGASGAQHAAPTSNARIPPVNGNRHRPDRRPARIARRRRRRIGPSNMLGPIIAHP